MPPGSGLQSRARAPHSPARLGTASQAATESSGEVTIKCNLIGDDCQRYSDTTISSLPDVIRQSMGTYSVRGSSGWTIGTGERSDAVLRTVMPGGNEGLGSFACKAPQFGVMFAPQHDRRRVRRRHGH